MKFEILQQLSFLALWTSVSTSYNVKMNSIVYLLQLLSKETRQAIFYCRFLKQTIVWTEVKQLRLWLVRFLLGTWELLLLLSKPDKTRENGTPALNMLTFQG